MAREIIDVFCHFLPPEYLARVRKTVRNVPFMLERAGKIPAMADASVRNGQVASFPGYRQIPCLVAPYPDDFADREQAAALARIANESLAEFVNANPALYPGFVATVPWLYADDACRELEYAMTTLGAKGVQIGTPLQGICPDHPRFADVFATAARFGAAIWLHPTMDPQRSDYVTEPSSLREIWWAMGVPYESSAAMVRLAYAGLFDKYPDLVVITHHAGGIVPVLEGRFRLGLKKLGSRAQPGAEPEPAPALQTPVYDALKNYYADTATLGTSWSLEGAADFFSAGHILFGTDAPFGAGQGREYLDVTIEAVETMRCPPEVREAIFSGNAKAALRL